MPVRFEKLVADNLALLDNIAADVFDNAIDPEQAAAFAADPKHLMMLAVDDDCVVGMASAVEYLHPDKPPQLWINEIGVAPTHRRQGTGRELIHELLAAGRERRCAAAWLGTDVDNSVAQACFDSVPGGAPAQPFLLYEWDL